MIIKKRANKPTKKIFVGIITALAVAGLSQKGEAAPPISLDLGGNSQYDAWYNMTSSNFPGPFFPGTGNWGTTGNWTTYNNGVTTVGAIGSNAAGSGDALLYKVSNGNGGGPFPSGSSIYYGGFSAAANVDGGTLGVVDQTPVLDLSTIVFQVYIGEATGYDFFNQQLPTLTYTTADGTFSLAANHTALISQEYTGDILMPTGYEDIYRNNWGVQFDLSGIDGILSYELRFTAVQHAQLYALRLDQSDAVHSVSLFPQKQQWGGAGGDLNWTTAANWATGILPVSSQDVVFGVGSGVRLDYSQSVNGLSITSPGEFTLEAACGAILSLASGGITADAGGTTAVHTIVPNVEMSDFNLVTVGAGTSLVFEGNITGPGIYKKGDGDLHLNGNNVFSGNSYNKIIFSGGNNYLAGQSVYTGAGTFGAEVKNATLHLTGGEDQRLSSNFTINLISTALYNGPTLVGSTAGYLVLGSAEGKTDQIIAGLYSAKTNVFDEATGGSGAPLNYSLSTITSAGAAISTLVIDTPSGLTSEFWGSIGGGGIKDNIAITKRGVGMQSLGGVSTYVGDTLIQGGMLRIDSTTALSPNSNVKLDGGVLGLSAADYSANLGTGPGQIQFLGDGGFAAYGQSVAVARAVTLNGGAQLTWGSGGFVGDGYRLLLSNTNANSQIELINSIDLGSQQRTIHVEGGSSGAGRIKGVLSGTGSLRKTGNFRLELFNANTYTGGTIVDQGILMLTDVSGSILGDVTVNPGAFFILNNSSAALNNNNRFEDTAKVNLNSATYNVVVPTLATGTVNYTETIGILQLSKGANIVATNNAGASGTNTQTQTIGSLQRLAGTTVNFNGSGIGASTRHRVMITNAPTLDDGIIGGWAVTVNEFATYGANGVTPYTAYTTTGEATWASTNNVKLSGNGITTTLTGARTINALNFVGSASGTGSILNQAGHALTLGSGGLLNSGGSDARVTKITGGTLTSGGSELFIINNGVMHVESVITGANSLVKSGSGVLSLFGANNYTGGTYLNQGTLYVNNAAALGSGSLTLNHNTFLGNNSGASMTLAGNPSQTWQGDFTFIGIATTSYAGVSDLNLGTGAVQLDGNRSVTVTGKTLTVGGAISGNASLTKLGAGTLKLEGASLYTGGTNVNAGILEVANTSGSATGTGAVNLADGTTLTGSGSIAGAVSLGANANLTPNGTLTLGSLVMQSTSKVNIDLGPVADAIQVTGSLLLDGILNLSGAGFVNGSYTLFTYGSTFTNKYLELNTVPTGYNRAHFALDTSTIGQVNLVVDDTVIVQYWNGSQTSVAGVENGVGGGYFWDNTRTNWTNATGSVNAGWQGVVGVFAGDACVVNIAEPVTFQELQFETTGYEIYGKDLGISGSEGRLWTADGVSVEISAPITGSGKLVKQGSGTVVLTGVNTYTGGTVLNNGVLSVSADNQLGDTTANAAVEFSGGALLTTADITTARPFIFNSAGVIDTPENITLTYTGVSSGAGEIIKSGAGSLVATAATLNHGGTTRVQQGFFSSSTMPNTALRLEGGLYSPGGVGVAQQVAVQSLSLEGGGLLWDVGNGGTDLLTVADRSASLQAATLFAFNDTGVSNGVYTLIDGLASGWDLSQLYWSGLDILQGTFLLSDDGSILYFSVYDGGVVTGELLQNSAPVGTPTLATFLVQGFAQTGSATQNNIIHALQFADNSVLLVHNQLAVTSGEFTVESGAATLTGGTVVTEGAFTKQGAGSLAVWSDVQAGGDLNVNGGALTVAGQFDVSGNVQLPATVLNVIGALRAQGSLNSYGGTITVPGSLSVAGSANLYSGSYLNIPAGGSFAADGAVHIHGGSRARVNGVLQSPNTLVHQGGWLQGSGLIVGNLHNAGTVAPGNSIGTLSIHGNYTQARSGKLQIEIGSLRHFDQLIVSGHAKLAGTLDVRRINSSTTLRYGDQYPFLQAGKITGKFDRILMPDSDRLRGRFLNLDTTGVLLVAPTSYTLVAQTPIQVRTARALDQWIGIESGDIGAVTLALDLLSERDYPAAFEAIQPTYIEGALSTGIELSQSHGQMLHQQLSARRLGARSARATGGVTVPATTTSAKGSKAVAPQVAPASDEDRWSVWTQGSGLFSDGGLSLTPGEDFESGTILLGADYALSEHFAVGLFASYQEGWGDYDHAGGIDLESTRFGGYATFDLGGFYANAAIGAGQTGFDIKRAIRWATLNRSARSEPDGTEFFSLFGTGYDFQAGGWTFGPQLSVQYSSLDLGTFTETGAGSLNLRVQDAERESLRSYLGGRVAYTVQVNESLSIIPEVRAFWQHEYLGGDSFRSSLDGGFGPGFSYQQEESDRDSTFIGAGVGFQVGPRFYGNVYYNADLGRNSETNHTISVSAQWKF